MPEDALETLLAQLEDQLRAFGAPIVDALQPGLPEDEIRSRCGFRRLYDEDLSWPEGFPIGWIPLMVSGIFAITFCADAQAEAGVAPAYRYDNGGGTPYPPRPQFDSLADLIGLFVRLFDIASSNLASTIGAYRHSAMRTTRLAA